MTKRLLQILGLALLITAALWVIGSVGNATTDEARYHQWQRPVDSWVRLVFLERHLPATLSTALHLPALEQRYMDTNEKIEETLVASGYLTNVHIALTNAGACRTQIAARLRKVTQENHAKWAFFIRSNATVVLTCRPQDVPLCVRAVESN